MLNACYLSSEHKYIPFGLISFYKLAAFSLLYALHCIIHACMFLLLFRHTRSLSCCAPIRFNKPKLAHVLLKKQASKNISVLFKSIIFFFCPINFGIELARFYLTFSITPELITPKLQFLFKIIPKMFLQSCPPCVANTTLGIYYTCVALCCSTHGCCALECCVACYAAYLTAIATLKLPCTRLVTDQSTQQHQPNTPTISLTSGGLVGHQGMQVITDGAYWGPS